MKNITNSLGNNWMESSVKELYRRASCPFLTITTSMQSMMNLASSLCSKSHQLPPPPAALSSATHKDSTVCGIKLEPKNTRYSVNPFLKVIARAQLSCHLRRVH